LEVNQLFTMALGLTPPWTVTELTFSADDKRLDVKLDFARGSLFPCPTCGIESPVHDTEKQTWRHLNFFQHLAYLHARQPRTKCKQHGVKTVPVPWARPGANFTLMCEALVVALGRNGMTPAAIGRLVGEHDTLVWRILEHYVTVARARANYEKVTSVGVDETSRAKGHVYVTLFVDMVLQRVLTVAEGKDHATVEHFRDDLIEHGGRVGRVKDFSLDMSAAFIKGIHKTFPKAKLTFDRFHVIQLMNKAVDQVRRLEQKTRPELKKTRYSWLMNEDKMKPGVKAKFQALKESTLDTATAWHIKTMLQKLYERPASEASMFFNEWYAMAVDSKLAPVMRVAETLKAHKRGVLRWFKSHLSNAMLEGFNSLVQAAKSRSRGFRSPRKMATIIYLLLAKLDFELPNALPIATHPK
jgi:transposase